VIDSFKARIVLFVKTIENKGCVLIITKRLTNRGESIRQDFCLVEEGNNSKISLLEFIELSTNSHGTCGRL
jgi:hypothetical protein